ncbi:MAG: MFS transporter [bacterium]|nr:MFS transporter [bacterium]
MRKNEWPLLVLILAVGVSFWNLTLPSPLQPYIAFSLGISLGAAAQLVTISAGAMIGILLVYGLFGSRVSPKYVIWFGLASLTFGSWLATTTDTYGALLAIRILNGFADGLIYPAAWVAIANYLPRNRWAFGNQWILIGTALSAIFGLPLANTWAGGGDWQSAFKWFTLAGATMLLLSLTLAFAKEYPHKEVETGGFQTIWNNSYLRGLLLANIFVAASWFGVVTFVGGFLVRTYQPTSSEVSWFFVCAGIAFTIGTFIFSENRETQKKIAITTGVLVIPLAFVFFWLTNGFWTTVAIASVYAFVRSPGLLAMETMLLHETERAAARVPAIAAVDMVSALGTLIGAALGGIILSEGTYAGIGVIFSASAALSLFFLVRTNQTSSNYVLIKPVHA